MMNSPEFGIPYVVGEIKRKVDDIDARFMGLAGKTEVAFLSARMDGMVPRHEHELHWKRDDERFEAIDERLSRIEEKIDESLSQRLPKWLWPFSAILAPIITAIASHYVWGKP